MDPKVLYEDEYVVAINKPAGLVVHSGVGTDTTLVDWITDNYPNMRDVGESDGVPRPGIVHRLDRDTSGAMLLAKDQDTFHTLKKHFQKGKVEKEYHAFVYGKPKDSRGTISLSLGRSRTDFRKYATKNIRGELRKARTEYVVVGSCQKESSFVRFYPKTGRTHQIRVHARAFHMPVVCDSLYAASREHILGFSRLALHSRRISLCTHHYPDTLHIIAPHPDDFVHAFSFCDVDVQNIIQHPYS